MSNALLAIALLFATHLAVLAAALIAGAGSLAGRPGAGLLAAAAVVFLPVLAGLLRAPRLTVPLLMAAWSAALLVLLPAALPHAPASAVNSGLGIIGGGCSGIGEWAYSILPSLGGDAPAPAPADCPPQAAAPPRPPPASPPATTTPTAPTAPMPDGTASADDIVIPYQTIGNSIIVPVTFQGRRTVELPMLFDTGATLTTLDASSMRQAGLSIAANAPILTTQTAAGPQRSPVTLIDAVSIGGHSVPFVTISRCEPCSDEQTRGLLGMNVSGRFLITIDTINQQLTLRPREGGQTKDVEAWLELASSATAGQTGAST